MKDSYSYCYFPYLLTVASGVNNKFCFLMMQLCCQTWLSRFWIILSRNYRNTILTYITNGKDSTIRVLLLKSWMDNNYLWSFGRSNDLAISYFSLIFIVVIIASDKNASLREKEKSTYNNSFKPFQKLLFNVIKHKIYEPLVMIKNQCSRSRRFFYLLEVLRDTSEYYKITVGN